MKDWIGFNKDAGSEVMAKVGQWNFAVAVKALVEAVEQHLREQERKSKELQPISPGETYEVVLCNGTKLVGSVDERGPTWVEMRDENGKSLMVRTSEAACFVEQSRRASTRESTSSISFVQARRILTPSRRAAAGADVGE